MLGKLIDLLTTKRQTDHDKWVHATVTSTDVHTRHGRLSIEDEALVRRCQQWVMVCARRNAIDCADQPLRLYTAKRSGGKTRAWTRGVSSKPVNKYLRDAGTGGPGTKAAMYAERAGDVEEVTDHPVLDAIAHPNAWQFGHDLWRLFFMFGELCGNRYIHLVDAPDGLQLYAMQSQHVRPVIDRNAFVAGYVYGRDSDIEAAFERDEVYHSKFLPSPLSPYRGIGPLHAVFAEADIDAAATENELAMWRNGARPDYVLQIPPEYAGNETYINQLQARINREHKGVRNRGKFLIAGVGEVKPLQFTPKEMEYILGKENVEQRIWAAFDVPESEVKLNDANLASSRTGNVQRMRNAIKPRINSVAEELTQTLLPLYGIEPGEMWFAHDNCVPADVELENRVSEIKARNGAMTINEWRQEDGREPVDGGDVPRFNGVPLDMVGAQADPAMGEADGERPDTDKTDASGTDANAGAATDDVQATALNGAQVQALSDLASQVAQGQLPVESAIAMARASFPLVAEEVINSIFKPLASFTPEQTPEQQAAAEAARNPKPMPGGDDEGKQPPKAKSRTPRSLKSYLAEHGHKCRCCVCKDDDDDFVKLPKRSDIDRLSESARAWLDKFTLSVINRLPQTLEGIDRFTLFDRDDVIGFNQAIADPMKAVYATGIDMGRADLPESSRDFDIRPSYEAQYLANVQGKLVRSVSETVDQNIRDAVRTGLESGQTGPELTQAVAATMRDRSLAQADTIARSEAQRVTHGAREIAWQESGVVTGKEWLLSGNPCPICVAMASKYNTAALGQPYVPRGGVIETTEGPFVNDFDDMFGPPAHPNCACSERPILREM